MTPIDDYKVSVPEGQSGDWKISRFTVTEQTAKLEALRANMHGHNRYCPAGTYTRLTKGGHVIMSDTRNEIQDHRYFMEMAMGTVLISGLGLGMVLNGCLKKPDVAHATVIEISPDVINLVGNYYQELYGDRLTIINADIMDWKPPKGIKYDFVWHDIWDSICGDNVKEMSYLHRKFGKIAENQGSWCKEICKRENRRGG